MKRILSIFILLLPGILLEAHPVHVSFCNIEIEDQKMTVSLKLFQDDFLLAIQHNFGKQIELSKADEAPTNLMINDYLSAMFALILNKKDTLRLQYMGSKLNEDAIWFQYEAEIPEVKKITIINSLLMDIYYDQTNLVILNFNGKQNGYRFSYRDFNQLIDLKK